MNTQKVKRLERAARTFMSRYPGRTRRFEVERSMLEIDEGEWPWILFATDLLVWATEDDPEYMHTNGEVWLDGMNYTRAKMSALWYATVARRKKARQQAIYDAGGSQTGLKQIDLRGPQWSPDVYMRLLS